MSGTTAGGKATQQTNYKKCSKDFYQRIGAMGGKASGTGGFYNNRELASRAGKIGGAKSRRPAKKALA